jgi:hypothetical protein
MVLLRPLMKTNISVLVNDLAFLLELFFLKKVVRSLSSLLLELPETSIYSLYISVSCIKIMTSTSLPMCIICMNSIHTALGNPLATADTGGFTPRLLGP